MYIIDPHARSHRLCLTFSGYKDHDSVKFVEELKEAVQVAKGSGSHFDILADFTGSMVMPQDIARESADLADWFMRNGLRRSANILQTVTQKMQIQRVTERDAKFAFFETREAAERWLKESAS